MKKFAWHIVLFSIILLLYFIGISLAALPIKLQIRQNTANLLVDGNKIPIPEDAANPIRIVLENQDPLLAHEIQIDGSDSINNGNYDPSYFKSFSKSFYYSLSEWMRGGKMYNRWQDLRVLNTATSKELYSNKRPQRGSPIILSGISDFTDIQISLFYPEAQTGLQFITGQNTSYALSLNRNDRSLKVIRVSQEGKSAQTIYQTFFPRIPWPFLGENLLSLARILLAGWIISIVCLLAVYITKPLISRFFISTKKIFFPNSFFIVMILLIMSFAYTVFIAIYEYQGMPHILDALAYYTQAKIFASGRLSAPTFAGSFWVASPFMTVYNNHSFMVFSPGTSIMLALGILIRAPWIIEPILGTLALLGIYLLAKDWFGRRTAYLSLILAIFSPFYSFLAASYLSHTVSLFFLVYMSYFWQIFCRKAVSGTIKYRFLFLSAIFLGFAFLTREIATLVVGGICFAGIFLIHFQKLAQRKQIIPILLWYSIIFGFFIFLYLLYNQLQTGNMWVIPRLLANSTDKIGFGKNIGFYGEHTVAAGLLILDQLLTSLQIELYGWPFAATLAFLVLPFLLQKANAHDYLSATIIIALFAIHGAFYYHSIAFGPRHLYEALPFFVFLTARGIIVLAYWLLNLMKRRETIFAWPVMVLVTILMFGNLLYYTPRHLQLYYHFTGLPNYLKFDSAAVYQNKLQNAVVLTESWSFFYQVLAALNDPMGEGDVLFAYAPSKEAINQLRGSYPTRNFYWLNVSTEGKITYSLYKL